jgi:V/A-type H+-transporting ATPase subunit E
VEREVSIQSLLDKIKREGIEEAHNEAERILANARTQAESIVARAENQARELLGRARKDADREKEATAMALSQASRNLIQSVRNQIMGLCHRIIQRDVAHALTPELMKEIIIRLVDECRVVQGDPGFETLLNEKDREALEDLLFQSLQTEFKKGLILKPVDKIRAGFHIGEKEGTMHYDFTDQAIAEVLSGYLGPRISQYLKDLPEDDVD